MVCDYETIDYGWVKNLVATRMKDMKGMKGLADLYVKNTRHYIDISGNTIIEPKV